MTTHPLPPVAEKRPKELTIHNHTRVDDYYWLREKTSQDVIQYLEAENKHTEAVMGHTTSFQEKIYQEMLGRIQETDLSAPVRTGDYYYYYRTEEGKQFRIYCRKQGSLDGAEEVLLDLNAIAAERDVEYVVIGQYKVSPNHKLLAFSLDTDGAEDFTLYVKDLESGELLPEEIPHTSWAVEWANDNRTFFYATQDHAKRSYKLHRHVLGQDVSNDELLFHETDELFRLNLYRTKDHAFIMLYLRSIETAEIHMLPADNPGADFTVIHPRQKGLRYLFEHHEGTFYVMSNEDAPNYKLMTTPVDRPGKEHWQEFIPHRDDVKLDSIDVFSQHLVLYERENGLRAMRVYDFGSGEFHNVSFPEPVYTYQEEENPEYDSRLLRFTYMSLTTPDTIYDYDLALRSRELIKRKPVLGGFDPDDYASERVFATALDGEQIPISLVYQKGLKRDGSNPCLLYGYGSYGYSIDPGFNSHRFSLIDRGIIYAIAHIRGGQEMGRRWYDQGKFLNKKNTFTDFIACGRALVEKNFTSHNKMAIMGRSAGGLLMGAVLNMAPDLAAVAVAGVPFVDVVTTMLDESIPLTVAEFEEWGNPKEPEYYRYMLSYSPYDNVAATHYPNILVTAGLNDPRVQYWEPAKWVARLRTTKVGNNHLLLKTNMGAGHAGASGRYDALKELTFEYAFILDTLGLHD